MPIHLEQFLQPTEIIELREMATHSRGWTYLLKLLRSLEQEARKNLQSFRTPNDAFERRGYSNGISLILDSLQNLYTNREDNNDSTSSSATKPESGSKPDSAGNEPYYLSTRYPG